MTSTPTRATGIFLGAIWLLMLTVGSVYLVRTALVNPYVDEWDFVDALFHERPFWPWLWDFHNEHRFPLPRLVYFTLFQITHDLRVGCWAVFLGNALTAWRLTRTTQRLRGRRHSLDSLFPLLLLHPGQDENSYMGYQVCFMLMAHLAAWLLDTMIREVTFRRTLGVAVLGVLLLMCGAGGLALGWCAAVWLWVVAVRRCVRPTQRLILLVLSGFTPFYTWHYFAGYVRPLHHPPSAGVWESLRVATQAQGMVFGPAAQGLWPVLGIALIALGLAASALLLNQLARHSAERDRALALFVYTGASAGIAFGIGWGRSGFHDDMGFAWRYGLLLMPTLWGMVLAFTLYARGRVVPYALLLLAIVVTPVNIISGFRDAERLRIHEEVWEADVRAGLPATELVDKHFPEYPAAVQRQIATQVQMLRQHQYAYYRPLP